MKSIKSLSIIFATVLLSGCGTTLKDFQKMSVSERTVKTCSSDYMVNNYKNKQRNYQQEINSLETLLMNGYKTIESCSTTVIDEGYTYSHSEYLKTKDRGQASPEPTKRVIQRCHQQNIPLTNYAVDKYEQRLQELIPLLEDVMFERRRVYDECKQRVRHLSVDEAYQEFKN